MYSHYLISFPHREVEDNCFFCFCFVWKLKFSFVWSDAVSNKKHWLAQDSLLIAWAKLRPNLLKKDCLHIVLFKIFWKSFYNFSSFVNQLGFSECCWSSVYKSLINISNTHTIHCAGLGIMVIILLSCVTYITKSGFYFHIRGHVNNFWN